MCGLGLIWLLIFIGMFTGEYRVNPRVEWMVSFFCLAWFAYWTFSTIRWSKKSDTHNLGNHLTGKCGCSETKESEQPNADTEKKTETK